MPKVAIYANMNSLIMHKVYDNTVTECGQTPTIGWQLAMPGVPMQSCASCFGGPRRRANSPTPTIQRPGMTIEELGYAHGWQETENAPAAEDAKREGI